MSSFSCAVSRLLPLHAELCLLRAASSHRLASEPQPAGGPGAGRASREGSAGQERSREATTGQGGSGKRRGRGSTRQGERQRSLIVVGTGSMGRRKKGLKEGSSGRKEGRRKGREGVIEGAAEGGRGGGAQRVGEGAGAGSVWTQQETSVFLPDFPADHKLTPHPPYSAVKKDR